MASGQSEQDLISRAVGGEAAALDRLLLLYHDRLAGEIARKIPKEYQGVLAADDVLQEAYVVVCQKIQTFQSQEGVSIHAWMIKIAENCLLNTVKNLRALKRGGGRAAVNDSGDPDNESMIGLLELLSSHSRTPSRTAAREEAVEAVRRALAGLSADECEALKLRYIEGLPVAETAVKMGRTEGSVMMLCYRGLQALRDALGDSGKYLTHKG